MRRKSLVASGLVLALAAAGWVFLADRPEATARRDAPAVLELASTGDDVPAAGASSPLAPLPPAPPGDGSRGPVAPEPLVAPPPAALAGRAAPGLVRVRALAPDGRSTTDAEITLAGDAALFFEDPPPQGHSEHQRVEKGLMLDTFATLRPGLPFDVEVTDRLGRALASVPCPPLAPGESRVVDVPLAAAPGALRFRLVDRVNWPIADVRVVLSVQRELKAGKATLSIDMTTDERGEVLFADLSPAPVDLVVQRFGRDVLSLHDVAPHAGDDAIVLVLDRGRRVTLRGENAAGEPLALDQVWVKHEPSLPVTRPEDSAGAWTVDLVTDDELALNVRVDGRFLLARSTLDDVVVTVADRVPVTVDWGADVERSGNVQRIVFRDELHAPYPGWCSDERAVTDDERVARRLVLQVPPGTCAISLAESGMDGPSHALATGTVSIEPGMPAALLMTAP